MQRIIWAARHASRLDFVDPEWAETAPRPHDPPLSDVGRRQAAELGGRLEGERIDYIFSSPFLRCIETACLVAERLRMTVRIEPGISEWLNRNWFSAAPQTLEPSELRRRYPQIDWDYRARGRARYGEGGEEALVRSGEAARRVARDFAGNLLFVGHGASVRGLTEGFLGVAPSSTVKEMPEMPYCCLIELRLERDRWRLTLPCDTSHLSRIGGGTRFH